MNYISFFIKKILNIITKAENTISMIGIWLCTILVFFGVINRYFLHLPILFIDSIALYAFVFYILVSIASSTREEGHIAVDVLRRKLFEGKPKADIIYSIFLRILSFIIALIFINPLYRFVLRATKYPEYDVLVPWLSRSLLMSAPFFVIILVLLHIFILLVKDVSKLKKYNTTGDKKE